MDITYQTDYGILRVEPKDALSENDFKSLGNELESILSDDRALNGVLIHAREFPGYESASDLVAHARFIGDYRDRIPKVAVCTDSKVALLLEAIGKIFAEAEVRHFEFDQRDEAEKWLLA